MEVGNANYQQLHRNVTAPFHNNNKLTSDLVETEVQHDAPLVDYEYEDHCPDIHLRYKHSEDDDDEVDDENDQIYNSTNKRFVSTATVVTSDGVNVATPTDATEVSQSPTQRSKDTVSIWSRVNVSDNPSHIIKTQATPPQSCVQQEHDSDDDSCLIDDDDDHVIHPDTCIQAAMSPVVVEMKQKQYQQQQLHDAVTLQDKDYPPMPPDRMARKQRSFHRRGGEAHNALLKSAVLASMSFDTATFDDDDDDDDASIFNDTNDANNTYNKTTKAKLSKSNRFRASRRESAHSTISLQSLQDALRPSIGLTTSGSTATSSPRKRARRGGGGEVATNNQDMIDASNLFVTMRVDSADCDEEDNSNINGRISMNHQNSIHRNRSNSTNSRDPNLLSIGRNSGSSHFHSSVSSSISDNSIAAAAKIVQQQQAPQQREAPPRRVSRKTSYDSRASDYDSDFDSDEWDL